MITPERLQGIIDKFEGIERQLGDPEVIRDPRKLQELSREHAKLRELVEVARAYARVHAERAEALELQGASSDAEMRQLARQEADALNVRQEELRVRLEALLIPPDPLAEKGTIPE